MVRENSYIIRLAQQDDWQKAMDLAWKTFLQYEADDYTEEGIQNFKDFITDNELFRSFLNGKYILFVACRGGQVIGMVSVRNGNHISLLFVDEEFHRQGVGRALLNYVFEFVKAKSCHSITVFAAPYGVEFYHRIGFEDLGAERHRDGIRYTPMGYIFTDEPGIERRVF